MTQNMTADIEAFMAGQDLRRCDALCANITLEQCKINKNKKSGRVFSCDSCEGLGESIEMKKVFCIVKGCDKWAQIDGKCKSHAHGTNPRATRVPVEIKAEGVVGCTAAPELDVQSLEPVPAVSGEPSLPITDSEHHIINLLQVLRADREAKIEAELKDANDQLGRMSDPVQKLMFVFGKLQAVQA